MNDPTVVSIAKKYGKTAAQILIRYTLQKVSEVKSLLIVGMDYSSKVCYQRKNYQQLPGIRLGNLTRGYGQIGLIRKLLCYRYSLIYRGLIGNRLGSHSISLRYYGFGKLSVRNIE